MAKNSQPAWEVLIYWMFTMIKAVTALLYTHKSLQCVSVRHWKKEGIRSMLSILAWVLVVHFCWEALIRIQPSIWETNQIKSRWAGKTWKKGRDSTEKNRLSVFSALWQSWWSTRADNGSVWVWYAPDPLVYHFSLTLNCISSTLSWAKTILMYCPLTVCESAIIIQLVTL